MLSSEILLTIKLQEQLFVDTKRIVLLKNIAEYGSISQAAKNAQVSYKSAWDHLEAMNAVSPKALFERNTGGKNGGGTRLTDYAKRLVRLYDLLEQTQHKAFEILQDEQIPLDSLLTATAKFSLQSSARNQFFGKVKTMVETGLHCDVQIDIASFPNSLTACITQASCKRLQLTEGKEVMLMVKAPWLKLHHQPVDCPNCFEAKIAEINLNETSQEVTLQVGKQYCYASLIAQKVSLDERVWVSIDPEQIVLLCL